MSILNLKNVSVDLNNTKKAALVFRALNHKLRQDLLAIIDEQPIVVTELYVRLRIEQSVASQHLAVLRKSGLVTTQRKGKFIYYSINTATLEKINEISENIINVTKGISTTVTATTES